MTGRYSIVGLLLICTLACTPENEHFCARYQYVYQQLLEDGLPSYGEMKQQLMAELNKPDKDKDQSRFMLFVLEDWHAELKPEQEPARDFCMRLQRWKAYP
jgi:hypothetical protein